MRRAISILISLILVLSFAVSALAGAPDERKMYDEGQTISPSDNVGITEYDKAGGAEALFNEWETKGYPNDVGGVYYDEATGDIVITLVGASQARRQELFVQAGSPKGLRFGESKYSHNEMLAAQDEITKLMADGKIYGAGIGWAVIDGRVTGFGESGKESRLVVTVDESVLDEYSNTFAQRYGDMVYVEAGGPVVPVDDLREDADAWLLPTAIAALILAGAAALLFIVRRQALAAQTVVGPTVAACEGRPGRRQVIRAVRESALNPSDTAWARLMERLDKQ